MTLCSECQKTVSDDFNSQGSMPQNIAGTLAYLTVIPAIIFLIVRPYQKNTFVRFHAFQSIFFSIAAFAIQLGLGYLQAYSIYYDFALIPGVSAIRGTFTLICLALWILCVVKAYGNEKVKLPIVGILAEIQASKA